MRKLIPLVAALALTAAIALPALAAAQAATSSTSTSSTTPRAPRAHAHWFAGTVSSVGGSSLGVGVLWTGPRDGSLNGQSVTVQVDSNTRIVSGPGWAPDQLSNIQNGDLVGVLATGAGSDLSTLSAARIHVYCNCHWVGGTIASLGANSITLQVAKTGPYDTVLDGQSVTIGVGGSTIFVKGNGKSPIAFSDLAVGEGVGIIFSSDGFFKAPGFNAATATFTAKRVHAWEHRQVPPLSADGSSAAQTGA
jgi:hypothetical protein